MTTKLPDRTPPKVKAPEFDPTGWLTAEAVQALADGYPDLTAAQITQIVEESTWVLNSLTDGRFHPKECWLAEISLTGCRFRIPRGPLLTVESVQWVHDVCGARTREDADWCLVGPGTVSVCGCADRSDYRTNFGAAGCGCHRRVRVVYSIKDNLPPGAADVVFHLAEEYAKAKTGKPCKLPERITQVSRQGVSWSILDPMRFRESGFTGLGRVDHWLAAAKRTGGGRVTDPTLGRLVQSRRLATGPCGDPFASAFDEGFDHPGGVK